MSENKNALNAIQQERNHLRSQLEGALRMRQILTFLWQENRISDIQYAVGMRKCSHIIDSKAREARKLFPVVNAKK